jgi:hypothetical protein
MPRLPSRRQDHSWLCRGEGISMHRQDACLTLVDEVLVCSLRLDPRSVARPSGGAVADLSLSAVAYRIEALRLCLPLGQTLQARCR